MIFSSLNDLIASDKIKAQKELEAWYHFTAVLFITEDGLRTTVYSGEYYEVNQLPSRALEQGITLQDAADRWVSSLRALDPKLELRRANDSEYLLTLSKEEYEKVCVDHFLKMPESRIEEICSKVLFIGGVYPQFIQVEPDGITYGFGTSFRNFYKFSLLDKKPKNAESVVAIQCIINKYSQFRYENNRRLELKKIERPVK